MRIADARNTRRTSSQRGFALISTIFALTVVLLLLMTVSVQTLNTYRSLTMRLRYQGQALSAANAGLVEGLDWFRRQTTVVSAFNPQRNLAANPPVDDTDIVTTPPSITRDFLISDSGKVWGRYVVSQGVASTNRGVFDVTQIRRGSLVPAGSMWQLESTGYIYVRNDPALGPGQGRNLVLGRKTVRTEIQKVALNVSNAAISILVGNRVTVGTTGATNARVIGTAAGNGVQFNNTGNPIVTSPAVLSGTPGAYSTGLATNAVTLSGVFNVNSLGDLGAVSDISVTSVNALPNPLPPMQLIVLDVGVGNTATFNSTRPLNGSGILVVNGNLMINGGPSTWNGVIYVTGNYNQVGPSSVYGSLILKDTTSTASITGSGANFGELYYDQFMVTQVAIQLGQFRFSRPSYVPCPTNDPMCDKRFAER